MQTKNVKFLITDPGKLEIIKKMMKEKEGVQCDEEGKPVFAYINHIEELIIFCEGEYIKDKFNNWPEKLVTEDELIEALKKEVGE